MIGRQIKINSQPFTIVGVAAEGFHGAVSGLSYDLWLPVGTQPTVMPGGSRLEVSGSRWLSLIGRLAPGSTREQARAELEATIATMRTPGRARTVTSTSTRQCFRSITLPTAASPCCVRCLLILMAVAAWCC